MNTLQKKFQGNVVPYRDDEIDLVELAIKIWQRKIWIIAITLVFTILAIIYAKLATPTFKLEGVFRPISNEQFTELNLSGVVEITPEKAMERYLNILESRELRRQLFNQPGIGEKYSPEEKTATTDQIFDKFNEDLKVVVPVEKKGGGFIADANFLNFFHENPEYGAGVVNTMLDLANKLSVQELKAEYVLIRDKKITFLENSITNKLKLAKEDRELRIRALTEQNTLEVRNVLDRLEVARVTSKMVRMDRIKVLQEAISIAAALNLEMPTTLGQLSRPESNRGTLVNAEVKNVEDPMYLRGTKFLSSELQTLQQRENDDFADQSIRDLEAELELLKRNREVEMLQIREDDRAAIANEINPLRAQIVALQGQSVNFANIQFVRIDQQAMVPAKPIRPKKLLIVAMVTMLGMMIGILMALLVPARLGKRKA